MKKIISVTIAVACMALIFVGCNAENGKIGNGANGTVTDNSRTNSSSNHAGTTSSGMNGNTSSNSLVSDIEGGMSAAGSAIESGIDNMTGATDHYNATDNNMSSNAGV